MPFVVNALRGNRTPGGSMATTQVTTTPLMHIEACLTVFLSMLPHHPANNHQPNIDLVRAHLREYMSRAQTS